MAFTTGDPSSLLSQYGSVTPNVVTPPAPGTPAPVPGGLAGTATGSAIGAGQFAAGQLPGYMTSMNNIGTNIASETAGQVPADVIEQLQEQGAESNAVSGSASNASYLKALGLTSLGLTQTGEQNLESILPSTPGYSISQNPTFQTSGQLAYEQALQPQVWQQQQQQQAVQLQQQQAALAAAQKGLTAGGSGTAYNWGTPTNAWSGLPGGTDALGFPNVSTANNGPMVLGGGATNPWTGAPAATPDASSWSPWTAPATGLTDPYAMAGAAAAGAGAAGLGGSGLGFTDAGSSAASDINLLYE